jgi:phosphatidate cytidylyltransferase
MVPEGEERGGRFDDLFEDLDKFFAPGSPGTDRRRSGSDEETDNAETDADETGVEATGPAGRSPDSGSTVPSEGVEGADGAEGAEGADDLLPPGWEPDIEGLDLGLDPTATIPPLTRTPSPREPEAAAGGGSDEPVPGRDTGTDEAEASDAEPAQPAGEPPSFEREGPSEIWKNEPAGEMTGRDWSRLRHVLGEEEGAEEIEYPPESSGEPEADLYGYEEEEGFGEAAAVDPGARIQGEHELTLDDLKKAPPEYRDLPGVGEAEAESAAVEGEADTVREQEAGVEEVSAQADAEKQEGLVAEVPSPREPYWEEPGISDVEAAADRLAAEFGEARGPDEIEEELLAGIEESEGPRTVKVGGPDSMTGPTWEEPTSQPLMAESGAPEPGRNLPAAVLTAAILAAAALISLALAKAAFAVVAGAVVLLGQAELYSTMQRKGHQPATALGLVIGGFTLAGAYLKGEAAMAFFMVLGVMLSFLWYMAAAPKAREGAIRNIASTMLGVLYVPFLAGFIMIILAQAQSGRALMLAVLGLTFIYDISAFLFGSFWGSRALAPTISPKKSWEGLFGATVVTFALSVAILPSIDPLTLGRAVGLALVVAVFAPLGDLAESALKRDLGVKDMGSLLPGHGGVLDRIDSLLFVAPAAFYFLRLIF